ncbi:MAG: hypothetical protein ACI8PT_001186, partial [Gammaproteobacteria bacterium]
MSLSSECLPHLASVCLGMAPGISAVHGQLVHDGSRFLKWPRSKVLGWNLAHDYR